MICFQIFEISSETMEPKCHSKRKENAFNKKSFVWFFDVDAKYIRFIFDSKWGQIFYDVMNQWRQFFIFWCPALLGNWKKETNFIPYQKWFFNYKKNGFSLISLLDWKPFHYFIKFDLLWKKFSVRSYVVKIAKRKWENKKHILCTRNIFLQKYWF